MLLVALEGFLWYLVFLNSPYFNGQIDDYNQNSVQTLSVIKVGSMSSPREAELQSSFSGNGTNLLSLEENPLGCSSRMPGNLIFILGFSDMDQVI